MALVIQRGGAAAGKDKDIIFVVEIIRDSEIYFLATLDITLSGQAYDGQVIKKFGFGDMERGVSLSNGGGVGEVGSFSLELSAKNENLSFHFIFN